MGNDCNEATATNPNKKWPPFLAPIGELYELLEGRPLDMYHSYPCFFSSKNSTIFYDKSKIKLFFSESEKNIFFN